MNIAAFWMPGAPLCTVGGIAATLAVSRLLSRFLFGIDATNPAAIGAAAIVLGLAAAAAAFLPAHRASGTDPLIALRAE